MARAFELEVSFTAHLMKHKIEDVQSIYIYRISANSFRGNYSFLEVKVRKLIKGGNYSSAETIRRNTVYVTKVEISNH